MKGKVMIIDGHSLAFRAFYAVSELTSSEGMPTNALVGFFKMFLKLKKDWSPDSIRVVFDSPGPTFRHEFFSQYKQGRKPTPDSFKAQLPVLKDMLSFLGIPVYSHQGVEADDVIGSMAVEIASSGGEALVVTSDKDLLQIIRDGVKVIRPGKTIAGFKLWDAKTFEEEYGFSPENMADYLALVGDEVDNVPGVPGVGDKTAKALLGDYGSIAGIFDHIDEIKASFRKKLEGNRDLAERSLFLTTIKLDSAMDKTEGKKDLKAFVSLCRKLGMRGLEGSMPDLKEDTGDSKPQVLVESGPLEPILESQIALHVRWSGTCPMDLKPQAVAVCSEKGLCWEGDQIPPVLLKRLKKGHFVTSDYKRLYSFAGVPKDPSEIWDLRTADYLLHPDRTSHGLLDITGEENHRTFQEEALSLWNVKNSQETDLSFGKLKEVLYGIDLPLVPVLVAMEKEGIGLDRPSLESVIEELELRLGRIKLEIQSEAGEAVNLNSPKQVGELLFEKLGLPPVKKTKTGYSTDVTVLEQLSELPVKESLVPKLLLEHRELSKMLRGFAVPLLKAGENSIIHSAFESDTTGTGRLSSRDPNLQNLPVYGEWSGKIGKCLIPKGKDRCFVAADYSQIELRVLAHVCGDPRLIDIFEAKRDIHTETAAMVFGIDPASVTKELRRTAKMVAFGLLYGMSSFGLAERLGVGQKEAKDIMNRYFKALPGVEAYIKKAAEDAISRGFTETMFGRIRPLQEVDTGNAKDRGHLKRVAINSPIQGAAADLAKKAMIKVHKALTGSAKMVLQVHDSIVCECLDCEGEETLFVLQKAMESAEKLSVPLATEGKIGKSLAEI